MEGGEGGLEEGGMRLERQMKGKGKGKGKERKGKGIRGNRKNKW